MCREPPAIRTDSSRSAIALRSWCRRCSTRVKYVDNYIKGFVEPVNLLDVKFLSR